jgi:hypothetical protein
MRADDATRSAYTEELRRLIAEVADGLPEPAVSSRDDTSREDRAILLLATLSGGVTLSRAVSDAALSERIADLVAQAALSGTQQGENRA